MTTALLVRPQISAAERPFEKWLSEQSTVRLICRINGHWWPGYEFGGHSRLGAAPLGPGGRKIGSFLLEMFCEREFDGELCGVKRHSYFHGDYTPAQNTYTYPPGYMTPEGIYLNKGRRGRIRLELSLRAEGQ